MRMCGHVNNYVGKVLAMFLIVCDATCWFAGAGRTKRVIEGIDVDCGVQPRVVSLRNSSNEKHLCGAVLLSQEFAVTAAHCVYFSPEDYFLQLNNYCVSDGEIIPRAIILDVITHDLHDRKTRAHDIALLRTKLNLEDITWLNNTILPSSSFGVSGECIIYGYGIKNVNTMETSEELQAGKLEIVSLDKCTLKLGAYVAPKYDSGMMCAVGDGVDACQGDSGSPLICEGVIQGLCSYGLSCGINGVPGVYTSVGSHLSWIYEVMQNKYF